MTITYMLTTADEDITLCDAAVVDTFGQDYANYLGCTVTARDVISDAIVATFEPALAEAAE